MTTWNDQTRDKIIDTDLRNGIAPQDIAAHLADEEVSAGEYEGCSSALEIAYSENLARIERRQRARQEQGAAPGAAPGGGSEAPCPLCEPPSGRKTAPCPIHERPGRVV